MKFRSSKLFAIAALLCSAVYGQFAGPAVSVAKPETNAQQNMSSSALASAKLMQGDVVSIQTVGAPELTVTGVHLDATGDIVMPYIGAIHLIGKTPSEVGTEMRQKLIAAGILVDPQVTVAIVDSPARTISIVGEVKSPHLVPAVTSLRMLDVLSAAGGLTAEASHNITVRRPGEPGPITVLLAVDPKETDPSNIELLPGDTVIVPKVGNVFVLGEVKAPQSFPLSGNDPITVMRALTMAGGVKFGAAMSRARIIRRNGTTPPQEISIDVHRIMAGKDPDPQLLSDDILFLPTNSFKAAIAGGGASVAASSLYGIGYIATK
jgi:polysaccharide export outer membrane protein